LLGFDLYGWTVGVIDTGKIGAVVARMQKSAYHSVGPFSG